MTALATMSAAPASALVWLRRLERAHLIVFGLLLALAVLGTVMNDSFLTTGNARNLLEQSVAIGLVSLGQTVVVLVGGIDLSVGALVSALGVMFAGLSQWQPEYSPWFLVLTLLSGFAVGAANAALILLLRLHALVVTIGMAALLNGFTLMVTRQPAGSVPDWAQEIAYGQVLGMPTSGLGMLLCFVLAGVWLRHTRSGVHLVAAGGNPDLDLRAVDGSGLHHRCRGIFPGRQARGPGMNTQDAAVTATATQAAAPSRQNAGGADNPILSREVLILAGVLALLIVGAGAMSPAFLSAGNIGNVLVQASPLCLAVLGQSLVIIARGLDLSVGSLMASVAVMATAFETTDNAMVLPILAATLLFAAVVGAVNGYLVVKRGISPFLATLAMMIVLQGLRFAYTKGAPSGELPPAMRFIGTGTVFGVPFSILLVAALTAGMALLLHRTAFGRRVFVVGANPRAADLVGISSARITIACYALGSTLAGLAGLVLIGYVGTVDNWVGRGYELDSIVAAVVGGVVLGGGAGSVLGALLGALILIVLFNIVLILGLPVEGQLVIKGFIIVLAAAVHVRRIGR